MSGRYRRLAKPALVAPVIRPDGTCPECANGSGRPCAYHSAEADRKSAAFWKSMGPLLEAARNAELSHIAARFEFESDEMMTWAEKAALYLKTGHVSARF